MQTSTEKGLATAPYTEGFRDAVLSHLATLASFNQHIQDTKFSFILGEINPQQASWIGENHHIPKSSQKRLWCNCTKTKAKYSCILPRFALCQHDFPAVPGTSWCNPQNVTCCNCCLILLLSNQKRSRTVAAKQWKSTFSRSWRMHIWQIHNVWLKGRLGTETRLNKISKYLKTDQPPK